MKKLIKPEIEFIEFATQDVITTSGDTVGLGSGEVTTTVNNAQDSKSFSFGKNSLWNKPLQ